MLSFGFVLQFADAAGGRVCAGLHDPPAVCKPAQVGSKHLPRGHGYQL